jgi:hypothetical protein
VPLPLLLMLLMLLMLLLLLPPPLLYFCLGIITLRVLHTCNCACVNELQNSMRLVTQSHPAAI